MSGTQPVISILQYGAVADGVTNNQAAIQSALNYAAAHGDAVYIPAGTFAYSGTLTDNGVTLYGAGTTSILKAQSGANESLILTGSGANVSNFEMLGTGSTRLSTWQSGMIWANGASNYTIDNVLINGSSSVGIASVNSTNGNIYSNTVENTLADSITSVDGSSFITISQNLVMNAGDDGISIVSYGGQPIVHDITETGNVVETNKGGRGMSVVGGNNVQITGNYIKGGGGSPYAGLYIAAESSWNTLGVSNVTATGNTLVNCGGAGTQGAVTIYSSVAGESLSGLVVNGNTIASPGMCPVQITGADPVQLQLENNTAYTSASFLMNSNGAASVTQSGNQTLAASSYVAGALPAAGVGSVASGTGTGTGTATITVTEPATETVTTGSSVAVSGAALADTGLASNTSITLTVTDTAGTLSMKNAAGAALAGSGTKSISVTDTLANLNTDLASLTYTAGGAAGSDTVSVTASSGTTTGSGNTTVTVSAQPTPTMTVTEPAAETVVAGGSVAVSGVSLADTNLVASTPITLTVTDTAGTLSMKNAAGTALAGSGTKSITLTDTLANLDTDLASLTYTAGASAGSDTVNVTASSGSTTGSGKTTVTVSAQPTPTMTVKEPATETVAASGSVAVSGASLADTNLVASTPITLTVADATGNLSMKNAAGTACAGSGTHSISVTDTLANLNTDLASLTYTAGGAAGSDTVNFTASSGSTTASGKTAVTVSAGTVGTTPDKLDFLVSGDGSPTFEVFVDGKQVGGNYQVTAWHSKNAWQDISITGDFGLATGTHTVAIDFNNAAKNRALYVGSLTEDGQKFAATGATNTAGNGHHDATDAPMLVNGLLTFTV